MKIRDLKPGQRFTRHYTIDLSLRGRPCTLLGTENRYNHFPGLDGWKALAVNDEGEIFGICSLNAEVRLVEDHVATPGMEASGTRNYVVLTDTEVALLEFITSNCFGFGELHKTSAKLRKFIPNYNRTPFQVIIDGRTYVLEGDAPTAFFPRWAFAIKEKE